MSKTTAAAIVEIEGAHVVLQFQNLREGDDGAAIATDDAADVRVIPDALAIPGDELETLAALAMPLLPPLTPEQTADIRRQIEIRRQQWREGIVDRLIQLDPDPT